MKINIKVYFIPFFGIKNRKTRWILQKLQRIIWKCWEIHYTFKIYIKGPSNWYLDHRNRCRKGPDKPKTLYFLRFQRLPSLERAANGQMWSLPHHRPPFLTQPRPLHHNPIPHRPLSPSTSTTIQRSLLSPGDSWWIPQESWPFLRTFRTEIWLVLQPKCSVLGCHIPEDQRQSPGLPIRTSTQDWIRTGSGLILRTGSGLTQDPYSGLDQDSLRTHLQLVLRTCPGLDQD